MSWRVKCKLGEVGPKAAEPQTRMFGLFLGPGQVLNSGIYKQIFSTCQTGRGPQPASVCETRGSYRPHVAPSITLGSFCMPFCRIAAAGGEPIGYSKLDDRALSDQVATALAYTAINALGFWPVSIEGFQESKAN